MRWRAPHRHSYSMALLALVLYARKHEGAPFAFGPLSLDALESSGLTVSGTDLAAVTDVLSRVPGLVLSPE